MKVRFFTNHREREQNLARVFANGLDPEDSCEIVETCAEPDVTGIDAACMVGVKSRKIYRACVEAGVVPIIFDKGYLRHRKADSRVWEYWRVSVHDHHPTRFLSGEYPSDRVRDMNVEALRWRSAGIHILLAGSSAKYHDFYGLPDPTEWANDVIERIRRLTDRPIVYRPKPSWDGAVPIPGTYFSRASDPLPIALLNAWCVVTHGSNISFEAALAGVPSIVLGNGVAKPISSTSIDDINDPLLGDREPWFNALSYWQWTEKEIAKGRMWKFLKSKVRADR